MSNVRPLMQAFPFGYLRFALLLAAVPGLAFADGFATFSKHEDLKGNVVVDAGDFEKIEPPAGKIGSSEMLMLNSNCFQPIGLLGLWSYGKKSGLLLVDRNKSIRVALLESSIGSVKVESVAVIQVACPTSDSSGLPIDPQQRLQELKRQHELLLQQIERMRQQQKSREK